MLKIHRGKTPTRRHIITSQNKMDILNYSIYVMLKGNSPGRSKSTFMCLT